MANTVQNSNKSEKIFLYHSFLSLNIHPLQKIILSMVWYYQKKSYYKKCFTSNHYIANYLNISTKSVERHLSALREAGYLRSVYSRRRRELQVVEENIPEIRNLYTVMLRYVFEDDRLDLTSKIILAILHDLTYGEYRNYYEDAYYTPEQLSKLLHISKKTAQNKIAFMRSLGILERVRKKGMTLHKIDLDILEHRQPLNFTNLEPINYEEDEIIQSQTPAEPWAETGPPLLPDGDDWWLLS